MPFFHVVLLRQGRTRALTGRLKFREETMTLMKNITPFICLLLFMALGGCDSVKTESKEPFRLEEPRIATLEESQWDARQEELLTPLKRPDGSILNVIATVGRHPDLLESWLPVVQHVFGGQTLPARDREMLILRIGWLCQAKYEFGQHTLAGKEAGLSDEEILRIAKGPDDPGWDDFQAALLRAADELHHNAIISDATWNTLSQRYDEKQMIDVVFTVGQYNLVSWTLNSLGVQLEEGVPGFPEGSR
jgi:4-carboxymuconolactone decarboxylase